MQHTNTNTNTNTNTTKSHKVTKRLAPDAAVVKAQPETTPTTDAPVKKERKVNTTCITYKARQLIREGKTRDQVWELMANELGLERRWYINWYFAEAKRKGIDITNAGKLSKLPTDKE